MKLKIFTATSLSLFMVGSIFLNAFAIENKQNVSQIEEVSSYDLNLIYNYIDKDYKPKTSSNRELTELENIKIQELRKKYLNNEIKLKNELSLQPKEGTIYLDIENNTYYYPDRELTVDEMLQYISWNSKVNYALGLRYENIIEPTVALVSEDKAIEKAKIELFKEFSVDLKNFKTSITYINKSSDYIIRFYEDELNKNQKQYMAVYSCLDDSIVQVQESKL